MSSPTALPKTLVVCCALAALLSLGVGCAREPGQPAPPPVPVNADDHALGRCVKDCLPDYGPAPISAETCAHAEAGLEFFPVPVWDFEPVSTGPGVEPMAVATRGYAYQDGTTEFLSTNTPTCTVEHHGHDPTDVNCQSGYEPTAATVDRCGSTRALHVRGGPFREWGGGIGRRLTGLTDDQSSLLSPKPSRCGVVSSTVPGVGDPAFCPEPDPHVDAAPGRLQSNGERDALNRVAYYGMLVDLREWEGISFWARRGPDSQPGFRVVLGDKNTDDDASFLETNGGLTEPRCRRTKECDCSNHRPCSYWSGTGSILEAGYYCWDPALETSPLAQIQPWSHGPPRCGLTQCDNDYSAYPGEADPSFFTATRTDFLVGTAQCLPYTFKNDTTHDECFDPNGQAPAEGPETCGDSWLAPVRLNNDWTFYKIPFEELRQEGYGKEFPALDRAAVSMVRFTWNVGWVDYWIDDVRFYRRQR